MKTVESSRACMESNPEVIDCFMFVDYVLYVSSLLVHEHIHVHV